MCVSLPSVMYAYCSLVVPVRNRLISWLSCVTFSFVTFPYGVLYQVWYLIVSIPDLCLLSYFNEQWSYGLLLKTKIKSRLNF